MAGSVLIFNKCKQCFIHRRVDGWEQWIEETDAGPVEVVETGY